MTETNNTPLSTKAPLFSFEYDTDINKVFMYVNGTLNDILTVVDGSATKTAENYKDVFLTGLRYATTEGN